VYLFLRRVIKHCSNYTGIPLLPNMYEILSNILLPRLNPYTEEIIGDHQCGFQHNSSTIDHIFCIHQLLEKNMGIQRSSASAIYRLEIHDSVRREVLYNTLKFGIPMKIVRLIKMCLNATHRGICVLNICLTSFLLGMVKTRTFLLPLLFNFALEYAIRRAQVNQDG
jgi:hypothetical protein